jgi:hypothetical protein
MEGLYPSPGAPEIAMPGKALGAAIGVCMPMFDSARPDAMALAVLEQIQDWTRRRFCLGATAAVLVAEVRCRMPFCPPLETAVAFWTEDGSRHQFRLYKPMPEVVYDDIGWLMVSPAAHDGTVWDCC